MSGRQTFRAKCPVDGCHETAYWDRLTAKDRDEMWRRYSREPWRCTRHSRPHEVLALDNPQRTVTLTTAKSKRYPDLTSLFWLEEGRPDVGSGFLSGPGLMAWANDFPEGTRLVITATITAPTPATTADEGGE